ASELSCDLYGGGQQFRLIPLDGGDPIALTTGPNGTTTVEVPAGEWELDEVGREWCRAESSDVNEDGNIVTKDGHGSVVTVYNCGKRGNIPGGGKNPPGQTPTQLPGTG